LGVDLQTFLEDVNGFGVFALAQIESAKVVVGRAKRGCDLEDGLVLSYGRVLVALGLGIFGFGVQLLDARINFRRFRLGPCGYTSWSKKQERE